MPDYGLVLVTASSFAEAQMLGLALLESQLAACVNFFPIHSIYKWEGEIHSEAEYQLLIKTDLELFSLVQSKVKELHSYAEPEIIAVKFSNAADSYLHWLSENVR